MKLLNVAQIHEMMAEEKEILMQLKRLVSTPESLEKSAEHTYDELVDDVILGVCFDVHRAAKLGLTVLEDGLVEEENKYQIVEGPDVDVFGQLPVKKQHECVCPSCHRNLAASRFAPHLEKCMGMGRNSSRIASRRIANNSKENASYGGGGTVSDDDDDADWTVGGSDRRRKRRDRHCGGGGGRRPKTQKARNGEVPPPPANNASTTNSTPVAATSTAKESSGTSVSAVASTSAGVTPQSDASIRSKAFIEGMPDEDKRSLLLHICGVISEHTGKLCLRTLRCPLHSDEQRRAVRLNLIGEQEIIGSLSRGYKDPLEVELDRIEGMLAARGSDDLLGLIGLNRTALSKRGGAQGDVEVYEGEAQGSRESAGKSGWEIEHSNTSSPADSASTSSSSSNKKREKSSKTKKKTSKGVKVSPNVILNNHHVVGE